MTAHEIDTGTADLQATLDNGVLTLTLNRPEARNALTVPMIVALGDQLQRAEVDPAVRCIVVTGAGKGFCSGGDVKAMGSDDEQKASLDETIAAQRLAQRATVGKLFRMPKPTIAAINGAAAGAGFSLALACDLRIMSSSAVLVTSFAKVGLSGDFGGAYFASGLLGTAKARELFFLSDRVDANEAVRLGLVNWRAEPDEFQSRTAAVAAQLSAGPSVAYRYMKENFNRAISSDLEDFMDVEVTHHVHCMATGDHQEAVAAFMEKRTPVFSNR